MSAWMASPTEANGIILIISDRPERASQMKESFKKKNCMALEESDLQRAAQTARIVAPFLVVLDANLPYGARTNLIYELGNVTNANIICLLSDSDIPNAL